jgi:hypothetical protein
VVNENGTNIGSPTCFRLILNSHGPNLGGGTTFFLARYFGLSMGIISKK